MYYCIRYARVLNSRQRTKTALLGAFWRKSCSSMGLSQGFSQFLLVARRFSNVQIQWRMNWQTTYLAHLFTIGKCLPEFDFKLLFILPFIFLNETQKVIIYISPDWLPKSRKNASTNAQVRVFIGSGISFYVSYPWKTGERNGPFSVEVFFSEDRKESGMRKRFSAFAIIFSFREAEEKTEG